MILFLDFDGVLHGLGRPVFENLPRMEAVLRDFPSVDVVISSSWRETQPWKTIVRFFAEDIQPRVIGVTPVTSTKWPPYPRYVRYGEIQKFMASQTIVAQPWLALDDEPGLFPPDCPELILCEPVAGFNDTTAGVLRSRLNNLRETLSAGN